MRSTACALLLFVLVGANCCGPASAQETGFWRWPFGRKANAEPAAGEMSPGSISGINPTAPPSTVSPATMPQGAAPAAGAQAPLSPDANPPVSAQRWMYESPTSKVGWPRLHMPEFALPKPRLPRPQFWPREEQVNDARNAWVQDNADPGRPSPVQAVKQGAQRVGASTRRAWHKTVDVLTPGDSSGVTSSRVARQEVKPPFWKRMLGSEEPDGPRTIPEWMAQERLDP
jgi:hypothetical protein